MPVAILLLAAQTYCMNLGTALVTQHPQRPNATYEGVDAFGGRVDEKETGQISVDRKRRQLSSYRCAEVVELVDTPS